ncbi:MAG: two component transcriptional regulator, LuxR family [Phycisphaerales bacterium]|nr:two component transcriptional regulator, LuxR family [Phycisphaerales bacterium]
MTLTATPPVIAQRRILLVDDHPVLREGLARMLEDQHDLTVCGQAEGPMEALRQIRSVMPDLVVLDLSLGNADGLEFTKQLHELYPHLPVLILSQHDETLYAERALRAGAMGYIMKQESPDRVMAAMRCVLGGQAWASERMAARLLQSVRGTSTELDKPPLERLTNREIEIFRLIGQGQSTRTIADSLCLSPKTVETHKEHLKQKLGLKSGNHLLQYAIECRGRFN